MQCYLLKKRIQFLEQLLQMKQDSQEKSVQTEPESHECEASMPSSPLPLPTEVEESSSAPDFMYEEDIESLSTSQTPTQVEDSLNLPEPTFVTDISLPFFFIKTEDKDTDVLFVAKDCRTHFLHSSQYFENSTLYNGKYISLRRVESMIESWNDEVATIDPLDREERGQIRYFASRLRDRTPFHHRIFLHRDYGGSSIEMSHVVQYSLRLFRFSFREV